MSVFFWLPRLFNAPVSCRYETLSLSLQSCTLTQFILQKIITVSSKNHKKHNTAYPVNRTSTSRNQGWTGHRAYRAMPGGPAQDCHNKKNRDGCTKGKVLLLQFLNAH